MGLTVPPGRGTTGLPHLPYRPAGHPGVASVPGTPKGPSPQEEPNGPMLGPVLVVVASGLSILTLEAVTESARSWPPHRRRVRPSGCLTGKPWGYRPPSSASRSPQRSPGPRPSHGRAAVGSSAGWPRSLDGRRDLPPRRAATRSGPGPVTAARPLGLRTASRRNDQAPTSPHAATSSPLAAPGAPPTRRPDPGGPAG